LLFDHRQLADPLFIRLALIPRLVTREALPSAIGYAAIIFNTSRILGPALGAWLITNASMPTAFFTAMLLFVVSLVFLLSVRGIQQVERRGKSHLIHELSAGFLGFPVVLAIFAILAIPGVILLFSHRNHLANQPE